MEKVTHYFSLSDTLASGSGALSREVEVADSRVQSQFATCDMEPLSHEQAKCDRAPVFTTSMVELLSHEKRLDGRKEPPTLGNT